MGAAGLRRRHGAAGRRRRAARRATRAPTTCFGEGAGGVLAHLAATIEARRDADPQGSYTARFLHGPREHAARKVGEEAVEVLLAPPGSPELAGEVADLWFHTLLLLARDGVDPLEPLRVLAARAR